MSVTDYRAEIYSASKDEPTLRIVERLRQAVGFWDVDPNLRVEVNAYADILEERAKARAKASL